MKKIIATLISGLLLTGIVEAAPYYVSDQLVITMRTGASTAHQVIKALKSGTKVDVIKNDEESGYSLIRLEDGTEGWALTRYLVDAPIAAVLLQRAEQRIEQFKQSNTDLKQQLQQFQSKSQASDNTASQLQNEKEKLAQEVNRIRSASANAIAISDENQRLNSRIIQLETQLQTLEQENMIIKDRSARDWFITGTGVTLLGILLGLMTPKISLRKKSNWGDL